MLKQGISKEGRMQRVILAEASGNKGENDYLLQVTIADSNVNAILDGGANCNLISMKVLPKAIAKRIQSTDFIIRTAGEAYLKPEGMLSDLKLLVDEKEIIIDALVVNNVDYEMILGKPFLRTTNAVTYWGSEEYLFTFGKQRLWVECNPAYTGTKVNVMMATAARSTRQMEVDLLEEFKDLFVEELKEVSCTNVVLHEIDTGGNQPIRMKPRRFAPKENEEIKKQLDLLLGADKIELSNSPWRSNLLFVPKPDGSWRMCIDFRPLNSVTTKDAQSLQI